MPNSRTGADPRDANPQRRRFVARFLAVALRIGFFFAFDFTAALAMSSLSLISLSSSNQFEHGDLEQYPLICLP